MLPDLSKPPRGSALIARKVNRKTALATRQKHKTQARRRDLFRCRWPGCDCHTLKLRLEVDHLVPLSRGGSDDTSNLMTFCFLTHQGAVSLHSGDLDVRPLTDRGADGPCQFLHRDRISGAWVHVATETRIGVSVTR